LPALPVLEVVAEGTGNATLGDHFKNR